MLNLKPTRTFNYITVILTWFIVLVSAVNGVQQLQVKQEGDSAKLYAELKYTNGDKFTPASINNDDYGTNCLCRSGTSKQLYRCSESSCMNCEKIVNITWYDGTGDTYRIILRRSNCISQSYSFDVSTNTIQVTLERNAAGDELNITLECKESKQICVNDKCVNENNSTRLEFKSESGGGSIVYKVLKRAKDVIKGIWRWIRNQSSSESNNGGTVRFYCGDPVITTTIPTTAEPTTGLTPRVPSDSPPRTLPPTTSQPPIKVTEEQTTNSSVDLPTSPTNLTNVTEPNILLIAIPAAVGGAVIIIIVIVIVVVVIWVRRKRKSSILVKYHVPPTPDTNDNQPSVFDEESDYNILGERVPVHYEEDDYDCPYSQNTRPQKPSVKERPEEVNYEYVDDFDSKETPVSSPDSYSSTQPLHNEPDVGQLCSVVDKDAKRREDQAIEMVDNDLYE